MTTTRKTQSKTSNRQTAITYKEIDFYRDKFAEWLTVNAGKEARSAFLHCGQLRFSLASM